MGLGSEGCCQWDNIVIEHPFEEGVLPAPKNSLELIRVVVIEMDVFGRE